MAVSKRNLPATTRICAAVDVVRLVIDWFLEGAFVGVGRIRSFIVGLAPI